MGDRKSNEKTIVLMKFTFTNIRFFNQCVKPDYINQIIKFLRILFPSNLQISSKKYTFKENKTIRTISTA